MVRKIRQAQKNIPCARKKSDDLGKGLSLVLRVEKGAPVAEGRPARARSIRDVLLGNEWVSWGIVGRPGG